MKTVRTMLYGDCEFSEWELELLHTPIMQRMYNIKQLGFTDKVFPDAIHSRFNHILGVASRAEKIISGVIRSLTNEEGGALPERKTFSYGNNKSIGINDLIKHVQQRKTTIRLVGLLHDIGHIPFGHTLEDELKVFSISHDEPERQVNFFNILVREFLYANIIGHDPKAEDKLLEIVIKDVTSEEDDATLISAFKLTHTVIERSYKGTNASTISDFLFDIETSMIALFYLDDLHKDRIMDSQYSAKRKSAIEKLFVSKVIKACGFERSEQNPTFDLNIDAFILDIIGNTICADLLDYAKRDCKQSGLLYDYDDRIFKYFTLVSKKNNDTNESYIQLCLQVYTNKLRSDVVSEIITILRTRYLLSERVLYHPTKCSAGAMLGCAVYMMGIDKAELDFFRIGDAVFLRILETHCDSLLKISNEISSRHYSKPEESPLSDIIAKMDSTQTSDSNLQNLVTLLEDFSETFSYSNNKNGLSRAFQKILLEELKISKSPKSSSLFFSNDELDVLLKRIKARLFAAKKMVWQIQGRQYYKKIFRIAKIGETARKVIMQDLAEKFKKATFRYEFERKIENEAGLPYGSVVIHCPKYSTSMKQADVLVFGTDPEKVVAFREILDDDSHELNSLNEYVKEAKALADSYASIWNMYFYVQQAQMHRWPFIERVIKSNLNELIKSTTEISNSEDLIYQLHKNYREPAKRLLEVTDHIESEACNPKPIIDLKFIEFIEEAVVYNKEKGVLTPEILVKEWNNRLNDPNNEI